jgi:nucleoside-diphosphate-sugar epimerase
MNCTPTSRHPVADRRLIARVLGRDRSLFAGTLATAAASIAEAVAGRRLLVIGAAGSIGSAVALRLAETEAAYIFFSDTNENGLAELARSLRSAPRPPRAELVFSALDFTGPEFEAAHDALPPFDYVLNFAALKHVRSESDPFTAFRMLRVNATAHRAALRRLEPHPPVRYFVVSTDKAVCPASLLGASKSLMERICLENSTVPFSSARFANVAFSQGSLPEAFLHRISRGEALAGPSNIRRYFISPEEAADLCMLACFSIAPGQILSPIPNSPGMHPLDFPSIAALLLSEMGLRPKLCSDEEQARKLAASSNTASTEWPCYFSPADTSGEKEIEEFYLPEEAPDPSSPEGLAILTSPKRAPVGAIDETLARLDTMLAAHRWTKADLIAAVSISVPEFSHIETHRSLFQKL